MMSKQSVHRRSSPKEDDTRDSPTASRKKEIEAPGNWFKFMVSSPLQKHMSKMELFTQWTAILVYLPVGISSMYDHKASGKPFNLEDGRYSEGISRLSGMQAIIVSFLYIVFSRASPRISSKCIILSTTFERIVVVDVCLYIIYAQHLLPLEMLLVVMALDTGLSIITIFLWILESKEASFGRFFSNIFQVMHQNQNMSNPSFAVKLLGSLQMVIASMCLCFPNLAYHILHLDASELDGHSKGLLSMCFLAFAAIGFIHYCSGGSDSMAYNIASVFYRMVFSVPVVFTLAYFQQIPTGLVLLFVSSDVSATLIILISFLY